MKYLLRLLIFFCCSSLVENWRPFKINFNGIKCLQKSELVSHLNCSLSKAKKGGQSSISFGMKFAEKILKPELNLLCVLLRAGEPNFVLANFTNVNGCDFLENRGSFKLLEILRKEIAAAANLPTKCPVERDTEIYVRNVSLNPDNFPPYVPEAKFEVHVLLLEQLKAVFELQISGNVTTKSRIG